MTNLGVIFILACSILINEITSLPFYGKNVIPTQETDHGRHVEPQVDKLNNSDKHSVLEEITDASYFPPSNGKLMHHIRVRIKNDANSTRNCAIKVWRENTTEVPDSPITIDCDDSKKKREVSAIPKPPTQLSTDNDDVKKYTAIGVQKYAHTMVNSSASSLDEILDAYNYPEGHNLLYKIKLHMNNCDGKATKNCEKMHCIVYVWRDPVLDRPVSIECDPIRSRRDLAIADWPPQSKFNSTSLRDEIMNSIKLPMTRDAGVVVNNMSRRRRETQPIKLNVNDPLVRKYAQMAVDKFGSPNLPDLKAVIVDIADATMFPEGDQIYEIKLKVGSTKCKRDSEEKKCDYNPETGFMECEIKVFKETIQPPLSMLCFGVGRRKRNVPSKLQQHIGMDDPEIKKYVDLAVERHVSPVPSAKDRKSILYEFKEAVSYPPSDKLQYKIKLRIGNSNCTLESKEKNCHYDPEIGYSDCEIDVFRDTNKGPAVTTLCSRID